MSDSETEIYEVWQITELPTNLSSVLTSWLSAEIFAVFVPCKRMRGFLCYIPKNYSRRGFKNALVLFPECMLWDTVQSNALGNRYHYLPYMSSANRKCIAFKILKFLFWKHISRTVRDLLCSMGCSNCLSRTVLRRGLRGLRSPWSKILVLLLYSPAFYPRFL